MRSIRDIRNKARRDLHARARVPAIYISPLQNSALRTLSVRLHSKNLKLGLLNNDRDWSQTIEIKPRIIVMRDQLATPRQHGIFSIAEGEAYRVDLVEPADGITLSCVCTVLPRSETASLPLPPDAIDDGASPTLPGAPGDDPTKTGTRLTIPILTPSTEWNLQHNLGYYPDLTLIDTDGQAFEADYRHVSKNQIIVGPLFPPVSGTAILV